MRFKRLLALLLAAALALAVLVGCGSGQQSAARVLLNLLDGKYPNVSVELDPDLEADLRQVLSENETDDAAAIRAALEKLVGSTVTFRKLGDGQQGDTTFDLVFFAGTDPDKAAQAAYTTWNTVFANLPDDGKYGTALAMVQTDNGIWMLVKATVEQAGTEDKPEPATVTGISVFSQPKKTQYNKGEDFDPDGMVITVTYSDGSTKTISGITTSDKKGVTWSPAKIDADTNVTITYGGKNATVEVKLITLDRIEVTKYPSKTEYKVNETFSSTGMTVTAYYSDGSFKPIAAGEYTIVIDGKAVSLPYSFTEVGPHTLKVKYNEMVSTNSVSIWVADKNGYHEEDGTYFVTGTDGLQNLFSANWDEASDATIILEKDQTVTSSFGDSSHPFTGTLQSESASNRATIVLTSDEGKNRTQGLFAQIGYETNNTGTVQDVDIQVTGIIEATGSNNVGAVAGENDGAIQNCTVTISSDISSVGENMGAGGVAGRNSGGTITGCTVNISDNSTEISGTYAGGVAGCHNSGTISDCKVNLGGTISGSRAGGVVGYIYGSTTVQGCSVEGSIITSSNYEAYAGGVVGWNNGGTVTACYHRGEVSVSAAGGVVGYNGGTVTACYHTGSVSASGGTFTYAGGVVGNNSGTVAACYWSGSVKDKDGKETNAGIGSGSGDATQVTGTNVTWDMAVNGTDGLTGMNAAIPAGCPYKWKPNGTNPPSLTTNP